MDQSVCWPTLTISEPSISFSFDKLSLILSGWARHFNRSSISPEGRQQGGVRCKKTHDLQTVTRSRCFPCLLEKNPPTTTTQDYEDYESCVHLTSQSIIRPFNYSPKAPNVSKQMMTFSSAAG